MATRPIPEGYHSVTPYLIVTGAASAIEFYKHAFGAKELMRIPHPDGRVGHAELQIGDSRIMLGDEFPEIGARSPMSLGGTPVGIQLYVDDVDAYFSELKSRGVAIERDIEDQDYGCRDFDIRDFDISPDGREIVVERVQERSDVVLLDLPRE